MIMPHDYHKVIMDKGFEYKVNSDPTVYVYNKTVDLHHFETITVITQDSQIVGFTQMTVRGYHDAKTILKDLDEILAKH